MGDFVFNIAKGKAGYYATLPAASDGLVVVLLKASGLEADATLNNYDDLASLLAASNDEADFTNYARKAGASVTSTVDDTNDWLLGDLADLTWASAGGASNNSLGKLLVCYDPDTGSGTDSSIIPLTAHNFVTSTNGTDLIAVVNAAGFYKAA